MSDEKQLIVGVEDTMPANQTDQLIRLAVQGNADIDKLERLIDLKNREEARQAKREFDTNFSRMQSEFTTVARTKQGYDYKYAPIEVLQKHYNPIISAHGFSYRWREEAIEGGKRCVLTISGHGHQEENYFDVPKLEGTKQMNAVQVAGAMSTYGRRYTFIAGFGIIISDEDDDAQSLSFDDGMKYGDVVKAIEAETTIEGLKETTKQYRAEFDGDKKAIDIIRRVYVVRRKELGGETED